MKITVTSILLFWQLLCFSQINHKISKDVKTKELKGKIITGNVFLADPSKILSNNNFVIIFDPKSKKIINILNNSNFKHENSFGIIGKGPSELNYVSDVWINEMNGNVEFLDSMDISVMLTPHFGDIDPPHRKWFKEQTA